MLLSFWFTYAGDIKQASRDLYGAIEEHSMYMMQVELGTLEYDENTNHNYLLHVAQACKAIADITGNRTRRSCLLNMRRHTGIY